MLLLVLNIGHREMENQMLLHTAAGAYETVYLEYIGHLGEPLNRRRSSGKCFVIFTRTCPTMNVDDCPFTFRKAT